MTYLFFVQGEGRGHLTQALTLYAELKKRGHKILAVIAGPDPNSKLPDFFEEQFKDKLIRIYSPKFVVDKNGQGINMPASVIRTLGQFRRYRQSLKQIKKIIAETNPDALINFYEPLAGVYFRCYRDKRPLFCIGHQYFIGHPIFKFPTGRFSERFGLKFYNWITAPRQALKIALSFTAADDLIGQRLIVCPPLIRQSLKRQKPVNGNFILIYLLNAGYGQEIINWSEKNPDVKIEAFWNKPDSEITFSNPNLIFHDLHGEKFMNRLANCAAYVSTAGFESIAEAAYLQKDILMIPTKNHFEQKCNAKDAGRAGIALTSKNFDLSLIYQKEKPRSDAALCAFKEWVDKYNDKIIRVLEGKNI
ncbi:MAG: UDP- glucuronosyltransferase [Candidatus Falkowbacteria bacterium]|nr:UDP- glucuronosyltransferase [Candidatus Falkowbacteria bacterium]